MLQPQKPGLSPSSRWNRVCGRVLSTALSALFLGLSQVEVGVSSPSVNSEQTLCLAPVCPSNSPGPCWEPLVV